MKLRIPLGALFGVLLAIGGCLAVGSEHATAQVPVPTATGTFTGPTSSPVILQMSGGQNSVWYHQVGTPGPIDVYGSNDGLSFTPLNIYSAGNVLLASNTGTPAFPYTGSSGVEYQISPIGFAFIYIEPDVTWSGQSSTILARGSASIALRSGPSGAPGATGPSGAPGAGVNLVAGPCITISPTSSPTPGSQVISNGCTPTPAPSPVVSPTACAAPPSVGPGGTIIIPDGCATPGATPTPAPTANLLQTQCANPQATHCWGLGDNPIGCSSACTPGPCPSTMADSVSTLGATAHPSADPLTAVPTSFPAGQFPTPMPSPLQCGYKSLITGQSYSAGFNNTEANVGYFKINPPDFQSLCYPSATTGTQGCNSSWTWECLVELDNSYPANGTGYSYLWSIDTNRTDASFEANTGEWQQYLSGASGDAGTAVAGVPTLVGDTFNSVNHVSTYYLNGFAAYQTSGGGAPEMLLSSFSCWGWDCASSGRGYIGRMQDCVTYNYVIPLQQEWLNYSASLLAYEPTPTQKFLASSMLADYRTRAIIQAYQDSRSRGNR